MHALHYIFLCAFAIQLFEWIGYGAFASKTWELYKNVLRRGDATRLRAMRKEVVDLQTELRRTSAQDEFAKWAKMRRRLDKLKADYEVKSKAEGTRKMTFELKISWGLRALLWGAQMILLTVYRSEPMFYLPREVLGPFAWLVAFPFAPAGSVSVAFWYYACKQVSSRVIGVLR
ncbi:GET complex subunit get1 [Geranomyces variabilis]|nr:GET complex subunit get1 [Geranomyces variabilis]